VRQSFHEDIADPLKYELVFNTGKLSIKSTVNAVIGAIEGTEWN